MTENNLTPVQNKEVAKEVSKRLHEKVVSKAATLGREFKKQVSTAIMAAFGLIIALSWKDVITDFVTKVNFLNGYGLLASAIVLTLVSVLGILLVSKWAKSGVDK